MKRKRTPSPEKQISFGQRSWRLESSTVEDITSYFHYGVVRFARRNPLNRLGGQTCYHRKPAETLNVNYIRAVTKVPRGFLDTKHIPPASDKLGVKLISPSGKSVPAPLCVELVRAGYVGT